MVDLGLAFSSRFCFFFNDTATTEIYTRKDTLSLHDALPICYMQRDLVDERGWIAPDNYKQRSEEHTSELQSPFLISYAVFCLKKKKIPPSRFSSPVIKRKSVVFPAPFGLFFFFNDTATTEIYTRKDTLSLHDALPI